MPPLPLPVERGTWTFDQIVASDAVRLFVERAEAVHIEFRLTPANAWDAAEICRRLDGLPLAIELAAARVKVFPPRALLARLERRLPLLTGRPAKCRRACGPCATRSHGATTCSTPTSSVSFVGWRCSWRVHCRCRDRCRRGWDLTEGAVVEDFLTGGRVPSASAASDDAANGDSGEPRFHARNRPRVRAELARSGEEDAVRRAHAEYFRALAERADPELRGAGQVAWIARLETELPNLRAVLDWSLAGGDVETGLRLAGALLLVLVPAQPRCRRANLVRARSCGRTRTGRRGRQSGVAAVLAWRAAEYAMAKNYAEEALERFAACDDRWGVAVVVHWQGHLAEDLEHDGARSIAILADSLAQFEAIGDAWGVAFPSVASAGHGWGSKATTTAPPPC